jgi:hypothetical protein
MATDSRAIQELLMVLRDAGVLKYKDATCEVEFAPPPPPPPVINQVTIARGDRGVHGDEPQAPQSGYDKLFRGNKPVLGTPAAE